MDHLVIVYGPQKAFGMTKQEIQKGILKIRISLHSNLHQSLQNFLLF